MEARGMPAPEFFQHAAQRIGYVGSPEDFVRAWQEIFEPNEPVIEFATQLKTAGHRLFLLSNTNLWHAEYFLAKYPVFELFDDHVFSHEEKCAKPEPRIYEIATERFGVVPSETLYIDDRLENVEAGRVAGYRTFHYLKQDVRELWEAVNG
jgi:HAD superfamily hydrolase (TIGR01509 family)